MADVLVMRKREAPSAVAGEPIAKRTRQDPKAQEESDTASSNSNPPSEQSFAGEDAATADTPPSPPPYSVDPNRSRRNIFHCTYEGCGKSFNRPCRLEEHIRSHTNERPFACERPGCTKSFRRQTHLTRHIKSEHDKVREHECDWPGCGMKFPEASKLRKHIECHENKFHCTDFPPCREVFRKHSTLQKHIRSAHLGQKKYQCTQIDPDTGKQCDQAYDSPSSLKAHEGRVHGGFKHFCAECSLDGSVEHALGFRTYAELQVHIKEVHPPTCEHCNLTCSTHKQLQAHVELAHSGLSLQERKKFPCPYPDCGSSFTKQGNLNVHIRCTHKNVRKFTCGETDLSSSSKEHIKAWNGDGACGRSFSSKGNLEEHVQTQHLGMDGTRKAKLKAKLIAEGRDPSEADAKPRAPRSKEAKVPMATRLTGVDYADATGRDITCLFDGCPNRFYREYDLQVHLEAVHSMEGREAAEAIKERAAQEGGNWWIGGLDEVMDYPVGGYPGQQDEWDQDDWEAQQELDRRAGIKNAGLPVDIHAMGLGGGRIAQPDEQHGEMYSAVWNYVHDQGQES